MYNRKTIEIFQNKLPTYEVQSFLKKKLVFIPFSPNLKIDKKIYDELFENLLVLKKKILGNKYDDLIIKSKIDISKFPNENFKTTYHIVTIDLTKPYKEIKDNYSKTLKRRLIKFENKISFEIITDEFEILNFYKSYAKFSNNKGFLSYPYIFFKNIMNNLSINKDYMIINSYNNKKKYLGSIFLLIKDENEALYFLSSKTNDGLNFSIDSALIDKAIRVNA